MRRALFPLLPLAALLLAPPACRFGYESVPGSGADGVRLGNAGEAADAAGGGTNASGGSGASGGSETGGTMGNFAGANDGMAGGGGTGGDASGGAGGSGAGGTTSTGAAGGVGGASGASGAAGSGGMNVGGAGGSAGSTGVSGAGGKAGTGGVSGAGGRAGASAGGASGRAGASAGGASGRAGASAGGASGRAGASAGGASGRAGASAGGRAGAGGTGGLGGAGGAGTGVTLVVTTQTDEADAGATPASPGSTGFSLREAVTYANSHGGQPSITFASNVTTIVLKSPLPVVQKPLTIQGAVALDASQNTSTSACLSVSASNVLIDSVEVHDCRGEPILFSSDASTGNQVSNCYLHNNGKALIVHGTSPTVLFNYVSFSAAVGIEIYATSAQVLANEVVSSAAPNIMVHDGASAVFLLANLSVGGTEGINIGAVSGVTAWHNTLASSVGAAFNVGSATGVDARNNVFSGAGGYGIMGTTSQFSKLDYDLFFSNASGNCNGCTPGGHSVFGDPLYNSPGSLDYSLKAGSPAIDAGIDLGEDRNLSSPGLYNGSAPDLGFIEAQ